MCSSKTTYKEELIFEVPYIGSVEDFLQHLMAMYYYLVVYPTVGTDPDEFHAHVVMFDDVEILFFPNNNL